MTVPAVSYVPLLVGAKAQSTTSADRPRCALVSAGASSAAGAKLGGVAKGLEWDAVKALVDNIGLRNATGYATTIANPENYRFAMGSIPTSIDGTVLSQYQRDAVARMSVHGGGLAMGVGLGKTLTSLAAVEAALTEGLDPSRCWIVAPLNAFPAWKPFVPWLRQRFKDVQIISVDSIFKVANAIPPIGGAVIFDEVHLLGAMSARRTKAAHEVRAAFDFGLVLTGTLLHGGIEKALSILDLAVPGAALFANRWKAAEYFGCLARKKLPGGRWVAQLERPTGKNLDRLQEYLSRFIVSLTKESESVRSEVTIPEQVLHTISVGDCDQSLDDLAAAYALRVLTETGEIPSAAEAAHALCRQGIEAKVDWVLSRIDGPTPLVVFAQYTDSLDYAEAALRRAGVTLVRVDGTTTPKGRIEAERAFRAGEVQVFLGQLTAAGVSMNLQTANITIALDVNWRAADYAQALGRTCRRGQEFLCHHFDLVSNRLQARVVQKLRAAEDFNTSLAEYQDVQRAVAAQGALNA